MPESVEAIELAVQRATATGFRGRLLERGEARAMVWRNGEVPEGTQEFGPMLTEDLLGYGYSLLDHGLTLLDEGGSADVARTAFRSAATAIESVIARGAEDEERGFHRVVAAATFHLARYSARAFSLLQASKASANTSTMEHCLVLLMLRDLNGLMSLVSSYRGSPENMDAHMEQRLREALEPSSRSRPAEQSSTPVEDCLEVVDVALTDAFMGAMSVAMLAFERGEHGLLEDALRRLQVGERGSSALGLVPQWWNHRLAIYILRGLWEASFHLVLPRSPAGGDNGEWERLRHTFIAALFQRSKSEIELWPSQLEAATRVLDTQDNLVLSLPTSAGKTRIAELCILATLAEGKRAVFVTPLRALSAQTEQTLERTFVPLGKTISTMYGSTGVSEVDENILQSRDIVVATPEKLDFALRNDPTLLDDVGLIVFDEGHMIGADEREIRYEIQVQKLLHRADAADRRIICLSAVLPHGEPVKDFVNWLTNDHPTGHIASDWRPTELRFGEVVLSSGAARLNIIVGEETPFIPRFLEKIQPPSKQRKTAFPHTPQELTLATTWRLVDDGQTVLIFCPLKSSVTALAREVVKLHKQGALRDLLDGDPKDIEKALTIGQEWFPEDHAILQCLRLGVAVHHGSLPGAYRKEIERLLQRGLLKVTISSPTLAQGLNLAASALVVHSIWRNGRIIEASEFRNVVGRAGRAFVDSVGLVVYPMYEPKPYQRRDWERLIKDTQLRDMQSGIVSLVEQMMRRIAACHDITDLPALTEYIMGNADFSFPELDEEDANASKTAQATWQTQLASLDTALLGLIGDAETDAQSIPRLLDELLESSLWTRSVARLDAESQHVAWEVLNARAGYIWKHSTPEQRRGWYLAGVGFESGQTLDSHADALEEYLRVSEAALQLGATDVATEAIIGFSKIALTIFPFAPKSRPENWEQALAAWVNGRPVAEVATAGGLDTVDFIEGTLVYRLPWALEAVRLRATVNPTEKQTHPWLDADTEFDLGLTVAAVETGTLSRPTALLIRAGFTSRSGAIAAIESTDGDFTTISGLNEWLASDLVKAKEEDPSWPSPSTHQLWEDFTRRTNTSPVRAWTRQTREAAVAWDTTHAPEHGASYRAVSEGDVTILETADAQRAGVLVHHLNPLRQGLLVVTASNSRRVSLEYTGPADLDVLPSQDV